MDDMTEKRLRELAERSWSRGIPCCTDFLDLSEQTVLQRVRKSLAPAELRLFGGAEGCERRMTGFGLYSETDFPIACLNLQPTGLKFAEELSHRDVLGGSGEGSLVFLRGTNRCCDRGKPAFRTPHQCPMHQDFNTAGRKAVPDRTAGDSGGFRKNGCTGSPRLPPEQGRSAEPLSGRKGVSGWSRVRISGFESREGTNRIRERYGPLSLSRC